MAGSSWSARNTVEGFARGEPDRVSSASPLRSANAGDAAATTILDAFAPYCALLEKAKQESLGDLNWSAIIESARVTVNGMTLA